MEQAEGVLEKRWNTIARHYDPHRARVFEPPAKELVRRAGIRKGSRVLDIGTGTGIAAFEALTKVGAEGYVLGVDTAEELLAVADRKAQRSGNSQIEFKRMAMTSLDLPAGSFDHVIGNYSVCCTPQYEETLKEAYQVLRPGGRITYNHEGPHQPPAATVFNTVLAKYQVEEPSERTKQVREANALVDARWGRFKDPFLAIQAVEGTGFREPEASISFERRIFPDVDAYLDYKLAGSLELVEMGKRQVQKLRKEMLSALTPFLSREGLVIKPEVLYLSGRK